MTNLAQTLIVGNEPVQVNGAFSTSTFLDTFGATPIAGRFFRADEERGANVAVLGEDLWRARFAADPSVVGPRHHARWRHLHRDRRHPAAAGVLGCRRLDDESVSVSRHSRRHHSPRLQLSAAGRPPEDRRERGAGAARA